jgi:hypothetical protein
MALRATSNSDHPRVREANELLRDRAVASGGWNYGNPRVFGADLRPFPETTGVALAALAGESRCRRIDQAIAYLAEEWPTLRSPMSLAWSVIGLSAWDARPSDADRRLAEASGRWSETPQTNANDALLLIAGSASGAMIGVSADAAIH